MVVKKILKAVNPIVAMAYIAMMISILHALLALFAGNSGEILNVSPRVVLIVLVSGVVSIAGSHTLYYFAVKHVGVIISNNFLIVSPLIACLLSFLIFKERWSQLQLISGIALLAGAFLTSRVKYQK